MISTGTGFKILSRDSIDERFILSKDQMLNINEAVQPENYFCVCTDDSMLYVYNVNNPVDAETGKFRKVSSNESVDPSIFQKINDDTLITEDKTIVGAINELKTNMSNINTGGGNSFSGSYNDLTDKPTIPTKTSNLENDSGFIGHPDVIVINKGNSEAEVNLDNDIPLGNSTVLLTGRVVYIPYEHELVSIYRDVGSPNGFVIYSVRGNKVNVSKSDGNWKITSNTTFIYSDNAKTLYQRITDNTLTTTAKTVPGAINELKSGLDGIKVPINISELNNDSGYLTSHQDISNLQPKNDKNLTTTSKEVVGAINELDTNKLDKPEVDGTAGQILVLQDNGSLAYADNVSEYDDTAIQEELDTKLNKPEVDGTAGQILVLQDDGSLAYQDNVSEFDDTEIQDALSLKIDKPAMDGTVGQILVVQDDGTLAYQDNVTETPIATVDTVGTVKPDGTTIIIDEDGIITAVGGGEGGASTADAVEYVNDAISVTNVEEALNKLIADYYYVAPSVTSFTASPSGGTFEIGTTITAPITFSWNYNKDITTQTLTDCTLADETVRTATYNTDITTNKTFTLSANDGKNNVSKSISYTFVSPYYTGVSATDTLTETDVIALTKKVETKGNKTINYTTSQSYMVFAYPSSYGAIKSIIDQNGFNVTDSFTKSTVTVNSVEYYVYCSNQCSGSYTMKFNY